MSAKQCGHCCRPLPAYKFTIGDLKGIQKIMGERKPMPIAVAMHPSSYSALRKIADNDTYLWAGSPNGMLSGIKIVEDPRLHPKLVKYIFTEKALRQYVRDVAKKKPLAGMGVGP